MGGGTHRLPAAEPLVRQSVLHRRCTVDHKGAARGSAGIPRIPRDRDEPERGDRARIPPQRSPRADEYGRQSLRALPAQWGTGERRSDLYPTPAGSDVEPAGGMATRALVHSTNTKGADTDYVATDFEPLPRFHRVVRLGNGAPEP